MTCFFLKIRAENQKDLGSNETRWKKTSQPQLIPCGCQQRLGGLPVVTGNLMVGRQVATWWHFMGQKNISFFQTLLGIFSVFLCKVRAPKHPDNPFLYARTLACQGYFSTCWSCVRWTWWWSHAPWFFRGWWSRPPWVMYHHRSLLCSGRWLGWVFPL